MFCETICRNAMDYSQKCSDIANRCSCYLESLTIHVSFISHTGESEPGDEVSASLGILAWLSYDGLCDSAQKPGSASYFGNNNRSGSLRAYFNFVLVL